MKSVLAILAILGTQTTFAQSINYKSVPLCTYWNYSNGSYTCSSYPMTEYIPDRFSLDAKVRSLESRIAELESKIAALTNP